MQWQATTQAFSTVDTVSPHALTLAPGQTGTFHVSSSFPSSAGDSSQDLVFSTGAGTNSVVPIALRSLVPIQGNGGQFSGNLVGGNGRNGQFQPGQINTYDFQVPWGKPELTVSLAFPGSPGSEVYGALISPSGQEVTAGDNAIATSTGIVYTGGLEAYTPNPQPGQWRFVVDIVNPVGGNVLSAPYQGQIGFRAPPVSAVGLPDSRRAVLARGQATTVTVHVTNTGPGTDNLFLDPRTPDRQILSLLSETPDQNITLPIAGVNPPLYLVPTETNAIGAYGQATRPITFDFGFGDPDLSAMRSGTFAGGYFIGEATPGIWDIAPDEIGPFTGPAPAATASFGMVARTRGFDPDTASSTGDIEDQAVDPNAAPWTPLTLTPGQSGAMTLTITPTGHRGRIVRGTLFVDVYDNVFGVSGEVVGLPYEYRVG